MARDADGIIQIKWANSGDVGLGGIDVNEMWDITYSQPGGPLPQRIQFNQFYRWLSALAVEINQNGPFLDYSALINYKVGAWVTGSDGFQYYCRVANGPSSSVVNPVGNPTEWKMGSNNNTLVVGSDSAIDNGQLQVANATSSIAEISAGGTGGQGSSRRALRFINNTASDFMRIEAFDFDASAGVKLRLNGSGGEVGIGKTPDTGKELDVNGDIQSSGSIISSGNITSLAGNITATIGNITAGLAVNATTVNGTNIVGTNEVVGNGKELSPEALVGDSDFLTGQSITSGGGAFNSVSLGTLAIGDTFIVTFGLEGTRAGGAGRTTIIISQSGTGVMSGPTGSTDLSNQMYSADTGNVTQMFSGLCVVTTAGTVTLGVSAATEIGDSFSSASMGLRVQFFRKA